MNLHACITRSVSKFALILFMGGIAVSAAAAQPFPEHPPEFLVPPPPLNTEPMPPVPGIGSIVKDTAAAIALGKALFWDVEAGSDGQACASCHSNAGADNRTKNSMSPGLNHANVATSTTYQATAGGSPRSGPNYTVNATDFPFTQFKD